MKQIVSQNMQEAGGVFDSFWRRMSVLGFLLLILATPMISGGKATPKKCIMVFGCHADDVEQMAGGTFAKYIADGYKGVYVCVENNLSGNQIEKVPGNWDFSTRKLTHGLTPSPHRYPADALETSQMRQEEALAAANVFGSEPVFLMLVEPELELGRKTVLYGTPEYIQYDPPGRKHVSIGTHISDDVDLILDLLKRFQPEITIIHTLGGEKFDHAESAYLTYMAFKKAVSQGVSVGKLWMNIDGWLTDPPAPQPDVQVDVKNFLKIKYEALSKHVSQNGGFGRDYVMARREKQPREVVEVFLTVFDNTK
ncbi:MAG: PIG-L family deacetylase [Bacteroidota bacterium]